MQTIVYTLPEYKIVRELKEFGDKLALILIIGIEYITKFTSDKPLK